MSLYDKKIADRLMDIRKYMNVHLKTDDTYNVVRLTLHDTTPRLNNLLSYMKSVGVDPDTNDELFQLLNDVCRPKMWDRKGFRVTNTEAVEWALIFCNDNSLEQLAWRLFTNLNSRAKVPAMPYLPEHLRSAAKLTQ